jgi:hypothetical protein
MRTCILRYSIVPCNDVMYSVILAALIFFGICSDCND